MHKKYFLMIMASLPLFIGASTPLEPISSSTFSPQEIEARSYKENSATDSHFNEITDSRLSEILKDPKDRISPLFKTPESLMPEVGFWFRIYSKYSLFQTVIYDKESPNIIYSVVDGRDLFKKGKSAVAIEITLKLRLKKSLAQLQQAFQTLIKNPRSKPTDKNPMIATLLKIHGKRSSKEWSQLRGNIRTQAGQRDRIMEGITSAEPYMPAMEAIFRKYELPEELVRIPLVESSFNLVAASKADAVGAWQFLEKSAQEYLVVSKTLKIDERLSPIKSSYAAARMFSRNYKTLGDYGLAVIAYNHGQKNLIKLRKKYSGDKLADLLKLRKNSPLGYASRNYYCEFLALLHAEQYKDEIYGMPLKSADKVYAVSIVKMKDPASIFDIAAKYKLSLYQLRKFNPDIFDIKIRLPKGTRVVIPRKVKDSVVMSTDPTDSKRNPANAFPDFEFEDYLE